MPDPNVNTVFTAQDKFSPTVKKIRGELGGFQKSVGGVGSALPVFDKLSAATGGLVTPFTLALGGAVALGGALVQSTKAAIAEQVNVAKLGASLRANVAGWDGNTKAIESQIKTRERLAFTDDELRDSLAQIVGATHDVNKAFVVQSTAMDLARLKGISLKDASQALIRVEGGQFRALKALGIVLKEGATATDALAAVQKVAAGQAEAYGDTIAGQAEAINIRINDLSEDIGAHLIPAVEGGLSSVASLFTAMDALGGQADTTSAGLRAMADDVEHSWLPLASMTAKAFRDAADVQEAAEAKALADHAAFVDDITDKMGEGASRMRRGAIVTYKPIWQEFDVAAFKAKQAARALPGEMARGILDGVDDVESAMDTLTDHLDNPPKPRAHLLGLLYSKELARGMNSGNKYIRAESQDIRDSILQRLGDAFSFARAGERAGRSFIRGVGDGTSGTFSVRRHRAAGGPVNKGEAYIVGEERPEVFVPNQNGTILPSVSSIGGASMSGGFSLTVNVQAAVGMTPAAARGLGDAVGPALADYLFRRGIVKRAA